MKAAGIFLLTTLALVIATTVAVPRLNHAAPQVAFMGDSLTQGWAFPKVNLGIRGQITAEMLRRFPAQIAGHEFRRVVILGGTNDTALGIAPEETVKNLDQMIQLARSFGAEPVISEIPPIYAKGGRYLPSVQRLNALILALARNRGVKVIDYYDALAGQYDAFSDGTHLKRRGYLRMEWALVKVLDPF